MTFFPATIDTPPFAEKFDVPLPRGLREQAGAMSWESLLVSYGHTPGPVRLGQWACADGAGRRGAQPRSYQATIAVGDRIDTVTASASGPLAALTAMLYQRGIGVEMLRFHQLESGEYTATFIEGSDGLRAQWAMGWSDDPTRSALSAMITCANRLLNGS
jgi:hypothetical protein